MDQLTCNFDIAKFLIFSGNVFAPLLYYSHFFAIIPSLFIGFFVFFKNKKSLVNNILLMIIIIFSTWVFFDLILWATEKQEYTMFFWASIILIEPLIYALCVYFIDTFITQNDTSLKKKFGIFLPLLPIIILLPTKLILTGFDFTNCDRAAIQGPVATYYVYTIEIVYVLWILIFSAKEYVKNNKENKRKILLITLGIVLFLLSFSIGNIVESFTENWTIGQLGLIGMPIFVGFLAYLIVRFKSFNIKLLISQILVFVLSFLVFIILFIRNIQDVRIVVVITLLFVITVGYILIKSVKKEVKQRERLEQLRLNLEESNMRLEDANDKLKGLDKLKSEFVSLASHQLRSPLTAIKGYTSMLIEGDYGEINPKAKEIVDRILESSSNLTLVVEDLLNVTKIEQGGMKYEMEKFDFGELAENVTRDLSITALNKGLKLLCNISNDQKYLINGDKEKIRQILINLIDNSIKYTPKGEIAINLQLDNSKIILSIKDTGVGIPKEIIGTLFQKFSRGEGSKVNTSGSGLGLYLVKEIVEAHKGRVWVESEGKGKGSTFFVEFEEAK